MSLHRSALPLLLCAGLLLACNDAPKRKPLAVGGESEVLVVIPALILFAVIPVGPGDLFQLASKVNVGVLYVLGVMGVAVYGITLAGWSSNNKYASLGSLRASAQVISYELGMGLAMVTVVLMLVQLLIY